MRTDKQKVQTYERLLHKIHMLYSVCLDSAKVKVLLNNISAWSYAHRSGNGMISEDEQQERIDAAFDRLYEDRVIDG
jgi:hypothetical protein